MQGADKTQSHCPEHDRGQSSEPPELLEAEGGRLGRRVPSGGFLAKSLVDPGSMQFREDCKWPAKVDTTELKYKLLFKGNFVFCASHGLLRQCFLKEKCREYNSRDIQINLSGCTGDQEMQSRQKKAK